MLNSYTRLWRIYKDGPIYCPEVAVGCISLETSKPVTWTCSSCGRLIPGDCFCCPGCQASREEAVAAYRVELEGRLPAAGHILDLGYETILELHGGKVADPRKYEIENIIVRLAQFEHPTFELPDCMAFSPDELAVLTCYVQAMCQCTFFFPRDDKEAL